MSKQNGILEVFKNKDNYLYPITVSIEGKSSMIYPDDSDKIEFSLDKQANRVFNKVALALIMAGISPKEPVELNIFLNSGKYGKEPFSNFSSILNFHFPKKKGKNVPNPRLANWKGKINPLKDSTLPEGFLIGVSFKVMKKIPQKRKPAPSQ